jgi:hypothetical protein
MRPVWRRSWSILGLATLAVLAMFASGCFHLLARHSARNRKRAVKVQERVLITARLPVRAKPSQLTVYERIKDLPRGLFYYGSGRTKGIFAVRGYPTVAAPHKVIAVFGWTGGRYSSRRQIPEKIRSRASKLGATALFRTSRVSRVVYALLVSRARPTVARQSSRTLIRAQAVKHPGYRLLGRPRQKNLADLERIVLRTRPSHCYKVVMALDKKADLGPVGQAGLSALVSSSDPLIRRRSFLPTERIRTAGGFRIRAPYHGKYVNLRAFTVGVGCAMTTTSVAVSLRDRSRRTNLGQGVVWAQVLVRRISRQELLTRKADSDRRDLLARIRAERYRRQQRRRAQERRLRREEERRRRYERSRRTRTGSSYRRSGSSGARGRYTLRLKNRCRRTVKLFIGRKPRFSSGRNTRIGSNTISSYSGSAPQTLWIVGSSGRGVSSYTLGSGRHEIVITRSCMGFARGRY